MPLHGGLVNDPCKTTAPQRRQQLRTTDHSASGHLRARLVEDRDSILAILFWCVRTYRHGGYRQATLCKVYARMAGICVGPPEPARRRGVRSAT